MLHLDDADVTRRPYLQRRELLESPGLTTPPVVTSPYWTDISADAMFDVIRDLGLEGYGLSESSPAAAFNHPHRQRKVGSIGTPIEGVEMRVMDSDGAEVPQGEDGEIQIRGHNVMKGYWNLPDATTATITPDGWPKTGDVGHVDEDGYFYIVDRTKERIIRGGLQYVHG